MESKVYQGQNLSDKAVEMTGSIENIFALAIENNVSITESLAIGTTLNYSGKAIKSISALFNDNNRCSTAITAQNHELIVADEGIGAMIIENTFIIG
ncbi:hypothetical protein EKM01_03895 [Flavobacterium sp. RSP46]|uniref:hypothetical protein n=1 Tax=Flavobacterium sp. RSP46 TaxID=2497486 RepID=UPI000F86E671|nr:hypothetical protein [Flavobacterium sp. RSP46]RTY93252.1 hypothetical protein EKM01_03895 [Flavobacterium sp. RSP46]